MLASVKNNCICAANGPVNLALVHESTGSSVPADANPSGTHFLTGLRDSSLLYTLNPPAMVLKKSTGLGYEMQGWLYSQNWDMF